MSLLENKQIGWIGLGSMGLAMATNIQTYLQAQGGRPLRCFNRTAARGESLKELGAVQSPSIVDLVRDSDVVCISMSDDTALKTIISAVLQLGDDELRDKIIVDTTTVHPDTTKQVAEQLALRSCLFLAGPVFGPTPTAVEGKLLMAFAGPKKAIDLLVPFFKNTIVRDVIVVSERPEKAVLMKTLGNFIVAGVMEIISEAHVLAEKSGLDSAIFESLLEKNFGTLAYSDSTRLTTGVYMPERGQKPWSNLNLALKDVQHGIDCAEAVGTRLKIAEVAMDHLKRAKEYSQAHGDRALDSSSLYGAVRQDAGLDFRNDVVMDREGESGIGK